MSLSAEIKRTFWKDYVVNSTFEAGSSLGRVAAKNAPRALQHSQQPVRAIAGAAARTTGSMTVVMKNAARNMLYTGALMSLRPHMNVSLAVGLSCVPTSASSSATLTLTKRAAAKALAFTAARFTAEHAMMERLKLRMNGGMAMRNGSKKSMACTFAAGMLAHTLMTVALGGAARLTAKAALPLVRTALARRLAVSSVATGLGYASVDKAYAAVYLDCYPRNGSGGAVATKAAAATVSLGSATADFDVETLEAGDSDCAALEGSTATESWGAMPEMSLAVQPARLPLANKKQRRASGTKTTTAAAAGSSKSQGSSPKAKAKGGAGAHGARTSGSTYAPKWDAPASAGFRAGGSTGGASRATKQLLLTA